MPFRGALDVFATPAVVAYMEMAACYAVNGLLEEGLSTVGTRIDIAHIKASPIGETITATATLKEIDGRPHSRRSTAAVWSST